MNEFNKDVTQTCINLRRLDDVLRDISKEMEYWSRLLLEDSNGSKSASMAISILNMFDGDCIELQKKILYIEGTLKRVSGEVPECAI